MNQKLFTIFLLIINISAKDTLNLTNDYLSGFFRGAEDLKFEELGRPSDLFNTNDFKAILPFNKNKKNTLPIYNCVEIEKNCVLEQNNKKYFIKKLFWVKKEKDNIWYEAEFSLEKINLPGNTINAIYPKRFITISMFEKVGDVWIQSRKIVFEQEFTVGEDTKNKYAFSTNVVIGDFMWANDVGFSNFVSEAKVRVIDYGL